VPPPPPDDDARYQALADALRAEGWNVEGGDDVEVMRWLFG